MDFAFPGEYEPHIRHVYPTTTQILLYRLPIWLLPLFLFAMLWTFAWWSMFVHSSTSFRQTPPILRDIRPDQTSPIQLSLLPSQSLPQAGLPITIQPTPLITHTVTPTTTPVMTPLASPTITPTVTPLLAVTATITPVVTIMPTPTYSFTTPSVNPSTLTPTMAQTITPTATFSPTIVPIAFLSPTLPTPTAVISPSSTSVISTTPTAFPTVVSTATITPTLFPSMTPTPTLIHTITTTLTATPTATMTETLLPSVTPLPTLLPTATEMQTATFTATSTETPTETPTAVATPTPLPSSTPMPTVTATATATPTPTDTPSITPTERATATAIGTPIRVDTPFLEPAETCADAIQMHYNGAVYRQNFSTLQEPEWFKFDATANVTYLIEATVQAGAEMADLQLEIYEDCYDKEPLARQDFPFTRDVRFRYQASATTRLYIKVTDTQDNENDSVRGYNLSVYSTNYVPAPGALIIVSGILQEGDPQQQNIDRLVEKFHDLYHSAYSTENIMVLSPSRLNQRSGTRLQNNPSKQALREAITQWASTRVGGNRPFTLYIADHGEPDRLYLDKPNGEWITPDELDDWLKELEEKVPGVVINVIIESSNSGSFITGRESISRSGRMIITSASADGQAYSTTDGAIFSDFFLEALADGATLFHSYVIGHGAATQYRPWQSPSLDANGNGIPNEEADYVIASMRGLPYERPDGPAALTNWGEPFIVNINDTRIESENCIIEATVRDDLRVRRVWSVIYKPSYEMPINDGALATDTTNGSVTIDLIDQGNDRYRVVYEDCGQRGRYRIVINADDDGGLQARPVGRDVFNVGVFLPLVLK